MTKPLLFIFSICSLALLHSCKNTPVREAAEACITDSFRVKGIESADELLYLDRLNDSMLYGFDRMAGTAQLYKKVAPSSYERVINKQLTDYHDPASAYFQYIPEQQIYAHIDGTSRTIETLDPDFNLVSKGRLAYQLPYLKDKYELNSLKTWPIIYKGDNVFLLTKFYSSSDQYKQYFSEHPLSLVQLQQGAVNHLKEILSFPPQLSEYMTSTQLYCSRGNKIFLIYPCFDTLYIYDTDKGTENKIRINNRDFVAPARYDYSKKNSPQFNKYVTEQFLFNFQYLAAFFNDHTKHLVLFYKRPDTGTGKEELQAYEDQPMHALVLDTNFNTVRYVAFKQAGYFYPSCFMIQGNRGFAIPKLSTTIPNDKAVTFYIFDL